MPGLIGKKVGMTSVFSVEGKSIPCTVIECGPCVVTQVKTIEKDGYEALQLGFDEKKEKHTTKQLSGHFKKAGTTPKRKLVEFAGFAEEHKLGDVIDVTILEGTAYVDIVGTSKGKGFAGTVKRWNFRTQDATHGNSLSHRVPGSIGQNQTPGKVFKGKKMAGQLGNERVTVQSLDVVRVDAERNLLLVKGAVPGATGSDLIVKPAVKA